jgi:hypothetical protein
MRRLLVTLIVIATAVATLPARDAADDRRAARRAIDSDSRERLKQYLAAFRRLSPDAQSRVRQLDKDLQDEDSATRSRLTGVMERYAYWLSRLSSSDRRRIQTAPAGQDRLRVVRDVLEQQWLDGLPPPRREMLAKSTTVERKALLDRWHKEDRDRNQERAFALRTAQDQMIPGQAERIKQFREGVERFVKSELEPKLNQKEKTRLQAAAARFQGTTSFPYLHQVWVMSQTHGLTPPGSPDIWAMYREPRRP